MTALLQAIGAYLNTVSKDLILVETYGFLAALSCLYVSYKHKEPIDTWKRRTVALVLALLTVVAGLALLLLAGGMAYRQHSTGKFGTGSVLVIGGAALYVARVVLFRAIRR